MELSSKLSDRRENRRVFTLFEFLIDKFSPCTAFMYMYLLQNGKFEMVLSVYGNFGRFSKIYQKGV